MKKGRASMKRGETYYRCPGNWGRRTPRHPCGKPTGCDFALVAASTDEVIEIYDVLPDVLRARRAAMRARCPVRIVALSSNGLLLRAVFRNEVVALDRSRWSRSWRRREVLYGWVLLDEQALFTDMSDVEVGK